MNKDEIRQFFDEQAPVWDGEMIIDPQVVEKLLDNACVARGSQVLDVACGTGVLWPYYADRAVASITGIDISPAMIEIARGKCHKDGGRLFLETPADGTGLAKVGRGGACPTALICGDAETYDFGCQALFDVINIYNAYPHFPDGEALIKHLASYLAPGGRLSIAHGMSRKRILACHNGPAAAVSLELPEAQELAKLMGGHLKITCCISDDSMYQVVGRLEK